MVTPNRLTGTVIAWLPRRGIGKIQPDDTRKVAFVHYSFVEGGELRVGERVSFSMIHDDRGLRAMEVRIER